MATTIDTVLMYFKVLLSYALHEPDIKWLILHYRPFSGRPENIALDALVAMGTDEPYKCEVCGSTYTSDESLEHHYALFHNSGGYMQEA